MSSSQLQVAIYARVSTDQQATANTIESQLAALQQRVKVDKLNLGTEFQFVDEGYSGATLIRPALERLRDLAADGGLDRLYVHSPDRLARKYAYQVLLVDELQRAGVEVVFLNRELGLSPEDDLLLQVQGMMAEYERAKILERSRRGKRHSADSGSVNALSGAPYGYHYIDKHSGGGIARYEIHLEQATIVRQIFEWVGRERLTINQVCRRLEQAGVRTQTGKQAWDRATVWGMLKNPAYKGMAAFGKTAIGQMRPRLRAGRGQSPQPRRPYSTYSVAKEEWIDIPVPALVDEALFESVQQQLSENRRRARACQRGAKYLLQGLIVCKQCGYSYYGKAISNKAAKGKTRDYAYYRCIGTDAYRFGGQRICSNTQVRTDLLEVAVWTEVRTLLENPQRLEQEYHRRQQQPTNAKQLNLTNLEAQISKLRQGMGRLIDSYAEGLIDKGEFEPRLTRLKQRVAVLEAGAKQVSEEMSLHTQLHLIVTRLHEFAARVNNGLKQVDWATQRELIRTLVKQVEVEQGQVNVVFRVEPNPSTPEPGKDFLQHCKGRGKSNTR